MNTYPMVRSVPVLLTSTALQSSPPAQPPSNHQALRLTQVLLVNGVLGHKGN